jgi:hypothetical protein
MLDVLLMAQDEGLSRDRGVSLPLLVLLAAVEFTQSQQFLAFFWL